MVAKLKKIDTVMLIIFILLVLLGASTLLSASFAISEFEQKNPYFYFVKHFNNLVYGLVIAFAVYFVPYQLWIRYYYLLAIAAIICLALPLIPDLSEEIKKTNRWSPYLPFQPSEVSKLAIVCALAYYFSYFSHKVQEFRYGVLFPVLLMVTVAGLIYFGTDLGGAIIVCAIVFFMMVIGGVKIKYLLGMVAILALAVKKIIEIGAEYRSDRITAWINPWENPSGIGLQIVQSFYAFANGGIVGVGPGQSQQKLFFLPEAHTDYIFAILGEEYGFIGVIVTGFLFLALIGRGFMIARAAKNMSGFFLAAGMTLCITIPAFLNMCVALSILPSKGLPLPFFSYGGSSILVSSVAMGIILAVSAQSQEQERVPSAQPADKPHPMYTAHNYN
jgi:cell division protein FtsW